MHTGGCCCGAVRFELHGQTTGVTYCHCSKCRRWHGHVGAYTAVDRQDFRFTEQRGLAWYAASDTVRRGFCRDCGSTLFFDNRDDAKLALCPGAVDAPTGLREKAHIFLGSQGDYYTVQDGLLRFDALPVRAG